MGFGWFIGGVFLGAIVYRWYGEQIEELLDLLFSGKGK